MSVYCLARYCQVYNNSNDDNIIPTFITLKVY